MMSMIIPLSQRNSLRYLFISVDHFTIFMPDYRFYQHRHEGIEVNRLIGKDVAIIANRLSVSSL